MSNEEMLERAKEILSPWSEGFTQPRPYWLDAPLDREQIVPAVTALAAAGWGYVAAITGLDLGPNVAAIEVLYHVCEGPIVANLRVRVPYDDPVVPSLSPVMPSVLLFEQEASEMLGITFAGLPFEGYLFLPDDWPQGVYPLRKAFHGLDSEPVMPGGMEA